MATDTGTDTASGKIVDLPRWATSAEVAAAYGISTRTLRLWASQGKVERRGSGRSTRYRMPSIPRQSPPTSGMPVATESLVPAMPRQAETPAPATTSDELVYLRAALIDAERRAAVAEAYLEKVGVPGDALEQLVKERDAARARVRELRTGTIARLARRVAELTR